MGPEPFEETPYLPELMGAGGPNGPQQWPIATCMGRVYDPTSGTISKGRIIRSNKGDFTGDQLPRS